jgi:hypothetical protein
LWYNDNMPQQRPLTKTEVRRGVLTKPQSKFVDRQRKILDERPPDVAMVEDICETIATGVLDKHLPQIQAALKQRAAVTGRAGTSNMPVGTRVAFGALAVPAYLRGVKGVVIKGPPKPALKPGYVWIQVDAIATARKFSGAKARTPIKHLRVI